MKPTKSTPTKKISSKPTFHVDNPQSLNLADMMLTLLEPSLQSALHSSPSGRDMYSGRFLNAVLLSLHYIIEGGVEGKSNAPSLKAVIARAEEELADCAEGFRKRSLNTRLVADRERLGIFLKIQEAFQTVHENAFGHRWAYAPVVKHNVHS